MIYSLCHFFVCSFMTLAWLMCDYHSSFSKCFSDSVDAPPKETMMEHKMEHKMKVSKMLFLFKWLISRFHGSVSGSFLNQVR